MSYSSCTKETMNNDTPLPLECLAEEKLNLVSLETGEDVTLPYWMTRDEAIADCRDSIKQMEKHIAKFGNTWMENGQDYS